MRYVIVDLEATCWMGRPDPRQMEIIEIGSVLLASKTGPIEKEFASFVRPIRKPMLSAFCMGLTGIQQHQIDKADDFSKVLLWGEQKRVITGSDILGRLLRGISRREPAHAPANPEPDSRHA